MSGSPPQARSRFVAGDGLRAIAALGVFVSHVGYSLWTASINEGSGSSLNGLFGDLGAAVFNAAALGLFVFFALSGYLIAAPFIGAIVSGRRSPQPWDYLWNRALRIVPAFWVILTVLAVVIGTGAGPLSRLALPHDDGTSFSQLVSIYGFAQFTTVSPAQLNLIPQAWTLDVEVVFYLAVPLLCIPLAALVRGLSVRWRAGAAVGLITAGCGISLVLTTSHNIFQGQPGVLGSVSPAWYMWAFAPGLALAVAEASGVPRLLARASAIGNLVPGLLLAIGAAGLLSYAITYGNQTPGGARSLGAMASILAVGLGAVGAPLTREWCGLGAFRVLAGGPLAWVGKRSYSLYLIHAAVLYQLGSWALDLGGSAYPASLALLVTALPLCLLLAHGSYTLVERPFLRLRTKPYGLGVAPASPAQRSWRLGLRHGEAQSGGSR